MINEVVKTRYAKDILSQDNAPIEKVWGDILHKNDLCILFGDSNAGKTILAHDIAFFVGGKGHQWFGMESPKIPTMYVDMEMTESQFANRYKDADEYIPDNFRRSEINALGYNGEKILTAVKTSIIARQGETDAPKLIVIDNITSGFGSIYSAAKMQMMISELKSLKKRFDLTILLVAHCPKRKPFSPITQDNLGGSKMLINFVDSAFAVAPSILGDDIKYIKQIKTRAVKKRSDVMSVQIVEDPYLSFKYISDDSEERHLEYTEEYEFVQKLTPQKEIELVKLLTTTDMAYAAIAKQLDLSKIDVVDYAIKNNL